MTKYVIYLRKPPARGWTRAPEPPLEDAGEAQVRALRYVVAGYTVQVQPERFAEKQATKEQSK